MKQIISIALVLMLSLQMALAQVVTANDVPTLPEQTLKPGDALYGLDRAMESIQYALMFTPEGKAKFRLEQAQERLAELQQLSIERQAKYAEELTTEYEEDLKESERLGAEISDLAHQKEHEALVAAATSHHLEVLAEVRAKIAERREELDKKIRDGDTSDDDEVEQEIEDIDSATEHIEDSEEHSNNMRIQAEDRIDKINDKGYKIPVKIGDVEY